MAYNANLYNPYSFPHMSRMGYGDTKHDSLVDELGKEYQRMSPDEKMMMRTKILEKMR